MCAATTYAREICSYIGVCADTVCVGVCADTVCVGVCADAVCVGVCADAVCVLVLPLRARSDSVGEICRHRCVC